MRKNKAAIKKEEPEQDLEAGEEALGLHKAKEAPVAAFQLELHHPEFEDGRGAWKELNDAVERVGRAMQTAVADVALHVRDLRARGCTQLPNGRQVVDMKAGAAAPEGVIPYSDVLRIGAVVRAAMKTTGLHSNIHDTVAQNVIQSELSGTRLFELLQGRRQFPNLGHAHLRFRNTAWRLLVEETQPDGNGRVYQNVIIETVGLVAHAGSMRFVCRSMHPSGHGRKAQLAFLARKAIIDKLAQLGSRQDTKGVGDLVGWSRGTLTVKRVKRPGLPAKWFLIGAYGSPGNVKTGREDAVAVFHRGAASMLTAIVADASGRVDFTKFPGNDVVDHKAQFMDRRRRISQGLQANPHRRRGRRQHFAALTRLQDAEARYVQTAVWRCARWAQDVVERRAVSLVVTEDFGSIFSREDARLAPYVRRFPFADVKLRLIDACTRRAQRNVQVESSAYISRCCPLCGHTAMENVLALPMARGKTERERSGVFSCQNADCRLTLDLDLAAAYNLLFNSTSVPKNIKQAARGWVAKMRL